MSAAQCSRRIAQRPRGRARAAGQRAAARRDGHRQHLGGRAAAGAPAGLPLDDCVGRGTGLDDAGLARKRAVLREVLALHADARLRRWQALAAFGGFEIATLVGAVLEAAHQRRVDRGRWLHHRRCRAGGAGAGARAWLQRCVAAHESAEPRPCAAAAPSGPVAAAALGTALGRGLGRGAGLAAAGVGRAHPARDGELRDRGRVAARTKPP